VESKCLCHSLTVAIISCLFGDVLTIQIKVFANERFDNERSRGFQDNVSTSNARGCAGARDLVCGLVCCTM
jgi:hypothetical protein